MCACYVLLGTLDSYTDFIKSLSAHSRYRPIDWIIYLIVKYFDQLFILDDQLSIDNLVSIVTLGAQNFE